MDLGALVSRQGDQEKGRATMLRALALFREAGYRAGVARVLEGFAHFAVERGEAARALRLAGAATAIRQALEMRLPRTEELALAFDLEPARRALGSAAALTATREGQSMTIEQAVQYALGEGDREA